MEFKTCKLRDIATIVMGQSPKGTSYNNKCTGKEFLQGSRTFGRIYPKIDTWTTEPKKIAKEFFTSLILFASPEKHVNALGCPQRSQESFLDSSYFQSCSQLQQRSFLLA